MDCTQRQKRVGSVCVTARLARPEALGRERILRDPDLPGPGTAAFHSVTKRRMIYGAGRLSEKPAFILESSSDPAFVALPLLPNTITRAVSKQDPVADDLGHSQCALVGSARHYSSSALLGHLENWRTGGQRAA
jgi:hypothetical protein